MTIWMLCMLAAALPAYGQKPQVTPVPEDEAPLFKVDVKLVSVFATVTDSSGAPVVNLQRGNFEVLEDGVPQTISVFSQESELPLSIVLAVDASLSTRKDIKTELHAARQFVHTIVRPVDGVSIYQFSEDVDELVHFSSDMRRIDHAIDSVQNGAATALYDAIYLGSETLLDRSGRKVIVLITDGGDTASHAKYSDALRRAQQAEAILYSIIMVPVEASAGRNLGGEHALIQLSQDTGGKYYYASDLATLDAAFEQISKELRTQYLIGYYPIKRSSDSDFHRIEIRLHTGPGQTGFHIRHRTGYYGTRK